MLAAILGWPQACQAYKLDVQPDKQSVHVTREVSPPFAACMPLAPALYDALFL